MSGLCGCLISNNLASLRDLNTFYSLPDALDLLEVIEVRNYNQWLDLESQRRKSR